MAHILRPARQRASLKRPCDTGSYGRCAPTGLTWIVAAVSLGT